MSDINEFIIELQARLDEEKSKGNINKDIATKIQGKINELKLQATIDPDSISKIVKQLESITGQKITISNINIDAGQAVKDARQTGQKIGNAVSQGVSSNLKNIKNEIGNVIKSIPRLDSSQIISEMNLNRASVGTDTVNQVRLLISEINNLGREVAKTGNDDAWDKLISKGTELSRLLDAFGKTRDITALESVKHLADYFNGKTISVGYKSSGLSGTDFTTSQLNKDLKELHVKFSATKQDAIELDSIWEEMCNVTGRMDLLNVTNAQDQLQTIINELQKAQSIINGEKGLVNFPNAHGIVSEHLDAIEKSRKTIVNLENEMSTVMQEEAQSSTASTDKVIQNEERKQQAYRKTAEAQKQIAQQIKNATGDYEKAIKDVTSPSIEKYFKVDASTSAQFKAEMEKLVREWTNAKGKLTDIKIDTRTSFDKEAGESIERLHQATVTYKNELNEVIKKTIAWRQIGTTTNAKGEEVALRGFVEVAGQYSKSLDTATAKTDTFVKQQNRMAASLQNTINQITSRAFDQNSSKPITSDTSLEKLNTQVAYVENAMYDLRNATAATFDDAVIKVRNEISELKILESALRKADNVSTKMKGVDVISGLAIARNDLEKFKADAKDFPQIVKTIQELDTAISKVGDASSLNTFNDQLRVARAELAKVKSETTAINRDEKVGINVSGLQSKIADLQRISPEIDKFKAKINGADVTVQSLYNDLAVVNTQSDFSVVNTKFKAFTDAAKSAGIAVTEVKEKSSSLFASFKNLSFLKYWFSPMYLIMQVIAKVKQAFTELKSVNSIMTEISKVTEMTSAQLKKLGDEAYKSASKYGRTISDYLTGVQEMSRAGFQGNQAKEMAELSVLAQAAGDISAELSNEYLIATNAAYKLNGEVSKLNDVLDGQNYVANRNAVSMEHLANATKVAASQAASSGVAVNEMTAAIGTMVATTQQGGEVAGRAFKAILMNIQQVSGELDDGEVIDEESLTKYEKACNDLGVSLKTVKDGIVSLRDPMQILKELAEAYTSLDEMDARRANLISAIGGKQRGNQLNALLENWSTYEKMLVDYSEGSGSAMNEAMKSANNWEGSLNRLHNTWVNTVENIANSDAIITIINGTNSLLDVLNKLTSKLGSVGTIGIGAFAFINKGRSNDFAL